MRPQDDTSWLDAALERYAASREPQLRNEIIEHANWLAVRSARRFADRGEPFDDLLQVARIGLVKAVDRFDPTMGVPFGAFATPTMIGELRRYFRDHTWAVHVSRRAKEMRPMVNTMVERLATELGRSPRVAEVANALDLNDDVVLEALEANHVYRCRSLDPPGRSDTPAPEGGYEDVLDRVVVSDLLDLLPEREKLIMRLRFFEGMTQSEIAARVGTSQVHVGRLIMSSLAVLRTHLHTAVVGDEDAATETGSPAGRPTARRPRPAASTGRRTVTDQHAPHPENVSASSTDGESPPGMAPAGVTLPTVVDDPSIDTDRVVSRTGPIDHDRDGDIVRAVAAAQRHGQVDEHPEMHTSERQ